MKKILFILTIILFGISIASCDTNNEKVTEVINLINGLPNVVTLDDENNIDTIFEKYNDLTKKEQELVTNYNVLLNKKEELDTLKENLVHQQNANKVIELINQLPTLEDILLTDKDEVLDVYNQYNELDDIEQSLVENFSKLNELVSLVNSFETVEKLINDINNLPSINELTYEDKSLLEGVRSMFDALDSSLKPFVSNIKVLEDLEEKMNSLVNDFETSIDVINKINNLPSVDKVKLSDKNNILKARNSYENLTSTAKLLVNNLSKLELLEEKIVELEKLETYKNNAKVVVDLINKLPSVITIDAADAVNNCFIAYDNLLKVEQEYVTNYDELLKKKKELEEIIASTKYNVKVELDGGYLDNMIEIEKDEKISEFVVKNYSCNIWTEYTTSLFIYKTSLMKAEDKFTSFLKIGFSLDANTNKFVVLQKVESGKALEQNLRTSDYYILVHPDYSDGFTKVNKLSLNNQIEINVDLKDTATDSLNAQVTVYNKSTATDLYIELTGMTTLPIPTKAGYKFLGWYLESSFINKVTIVSKSTTIYARWEVDKGEINTENILNAVSNVAESSTVDTLPLENDDAYFTWSSSNNNLYNINNGLGTVSKVYQTHKKQTVTISVEVRYKTGSSKTLSKEITVNPVKFTDFSSTPIATYFYTGAISAYKKYNERYLSNQTLFSETTKETLDIVYYAFIVPKSDGSVSFQNVSYLDEVRELRNHNVRILGCVNGVGTDTSTAFKVITADQNLRKTFINNLMDMVEEYNLDGLDLDWEAISSSLKPIASQYNLLCQELRAEMTRRQDEGGSPYLLTMAVPASSYGTATDRFDFSTLNKYVDYINIMSYDLNDTTKASHLSPLYTSKKDNGYGFGAVYGVNRISSLGFDKNKLIIGCAGYGKAYKVTSASGTYPALGTSGTLTQISGYDGSFKSGTVYGSTINQLIKSGKYKQYTELDSNGKVVGSYLYSETDKIFITFDSKEAVMAKYEYAASIGVGMMCWAYTEDTSDTVINAIYEAMNK